MTGADFDVLRQKLATTDTTPLRGQVREVIGTVVKAAIPRGRVGDVVTIRGRGGDLRAEIVGFQEERAVLMPFGPVDGIGPDSEVRSSDSEALTIACSAGMLGRVVDGLGAPIDGGPPIEGAPWPIERSAPSPFGRPRIDTAMSTGIRAIDGLLTLGVGQRVGLFAGPGVGKSTLLAQIARRSSADVNIVCLVGERGRELREFVEDALGEEGLAQSVVVCATSDAPALVRLKSAWTATAIAEWFRDQGANVLLLMDSVTRFARAQREIGLAAGEPPTRRGFPPSTFSMLPRLVERAGRSPAGSITAIYTVLVEGNDMDEPIADEVRGLLDGHILLDRRLADRGHWPAIDILPSLSRIMGHVVSPEHRELASEFRELLAAYESQRDMITLGAYEEGSDERVDRAIYAMQEMEEFLRQGPDDDEDLHSTVDFLRSLRL